MTNANEGQVLPQWAVGSTVRATAFIVEDADQVLNFHNRVKMGRGAATMNDRTKQHPIEAAFSWAVTDAGHSRWWQWQGNRWIAALPTPGSWCVLTDGQPPSRNPPRDWQDSVVMRPHACRFVLGPRTADTCAHCDACLSGAYVVGSAIAVRRTEHLRATRWCAAHCLYAAEAALEIRMVPAPAAPWLLEDQEEKSA